MKRIFAVFMMMSMVFSLASCNYVEPSESVKQNEATIGDQNEEITDPKNQQTENENSEIENSRPAEYVAKNMETFLLDFEQDATVRELFFYRYDINDHSLRKDLPSVDDTILVPKLKTDQFVCASIAACENLYMFSYLPSDEDPKHEAAATIFGGFYIQVSKRPDSCSRWTENNDLEIYGDYAYDKSREVLLLNEDGQAVCIDHDENALDLVSRAAIEEIIEFERYGYNENGLYLITEE